jgi:hypothetical protein
METAGIQALNLALAAELQLIAAYDYGEEAHLLHPPALDLARTYRAHHEEHAALLAEAVKKLGGTPLEGAAGDEFATGALLDEEDVLQLAARLEQRAVGAYLKALAHMPGHPDVAHAAATILGNDALHCAVLRQALGERPVFMA